MKQTVVLFPGVGVGHLTPTVELAKLFIAQNFSVTVVIIESPYDPLSTIAASVSRITAAYPSITFHHLPKISLPTGTANPSLSVLDLLRSSTPHLKGFLQALTQTVDLRALVLDFFCTDALEVAAELCIPAYFFFTASASSLAAFLFLPTIHSQTPASFKDLGGDAIRIPGVHPIPVSDIPASLHDRNSEVYQTIIGGFQKLPTGDGIIINTLESLENRAVQALRDGLCVPGRRMPPIYCIGPLVASKGEEKHESLKWLDEQPKGSVVFLCFGSMGSFPAEQVKEIAVGLERSGQRFLWVVRAPPSDDPKKQLESRPEPELSVLMPEGFLERTKARGMVVKSWAPQEAVLRHESVGGFVSHCGWNSTLEAVSTGVPIIAWPLYAEQRMTKVFLVEEAKLAVEMKGYDKELVSAEEIANKVRWLMESDGGKVLRDRAAAAKEITIKAWKADGSSAAAWMELLNHLKKPSN